jgi:hypothetical protein
MEDLEGSRHYHVDAAVPSNTPLDLPSCVAGVGGKGTGEVIEDRCSPDLRCCKVNSMIPGINIANLLNLSCVATLVFTNSDAEGKWSTDMSFAVTRSSAINTQAFRVGHSAKLSSTAYRHLMGKNKARNLIPSEDHLLLPPHPAGSGAGTKIADTHTHIASTFAAYRSKYHQGKYETVFDFVRAMCEGRNVDAVVDVWCEAPVQKMWREFADSALTVESRERNWGGIEYWFVMGKLRCNASKILYAKVVTPRGSSVRVHRIHPHPR